MVDDTYFVDLSDVVEDFNEDFFRSGRLPSLEHIIAERRAEAEPLGVMRLGPPISRPHQVICIGLNYRDHALETKQPIPTEPIVFTKSPNTIQGPDDDVRIPRGSEKTDWEVELALVVGQPCLYLRDEAEARGAIAGYMISNDISEREWQLERQGQWSKGKSAPTFNPSGPWLVTPDEIPDVMNLDLKLRVNDFDRQVGSTSRMIFSPAFIVHYLSQFMALEPGDVINTGTPPGVGMASTPPVFLHGGEVLTLSITGLGSQRHRVVNERAE
jgi:2,4-diketo-3-deoxy-L-fuconate hydrolase